MPVYQNNLSMQCIIMVTIPSVIGCIMATVLSVLMTLCISTCVFDAKQFEMLL